MIAPAPMKPMPVTICAAMRVGSNVTPLACEKAKSPHAYAETSVNSAAPDGDEHVRPEARFPLAQLALDADDAAERGRRGEPHEDLPGREVRHARPATGAILLGANPLDPTRCELEQLVELLPRERRPLGGRLDVDVRAVAGHDDVEVDVGLRVLGVVEVEQRLARRRCPPTPPRPRRAAPSRARSGRARGGRPPRRR